MEKILVKVEEQDTGLEIVGNKEHSLRKQHRQDELYHSQPVNISTSGKKPSASHCSTLSAQRHLPVQHYRTPAVGLKQRTVTAASNTYNLGARCGEIFVANNAKQWTFVCTFCNKSTRDIGDFICHIKIKHLEEPDEPRDQYGNDFYEDDSEDDEAYSQTQDVSNYFGNNRRAIEIIPINHESLKPSCLNISTPKERRRVESMSSEYLDCGNYLDINVHSEPEELTYSNGDNYGVKYDDRLQYHSTASRQRKANDWNVNKEQKQDQQPMQQNKLKHKKNEHKQSNVVKLSNRSDDDIDDILQTHTSLRKQTNSLQREQPQQHEQQLLDHLQNQQQQIYRITGKPRLSNGTNDSNFDKSMDVNSEDAPSDYISYKNPEFSDEDFDNQLLLAPTDSSTHCTDGKVKRLQIRGTAYCSLCNKTFQYYSLYRNHMIKHSNETPFKCSLCRKGFKSKQAIRYHMNTHQRAAKFRCEICEMGFYAENQFITHMLTHENSNTYPCMVCGKVMHNENERNAHLAVHTEERPFRCEFCQKLFRLRHHLSNHLKMHRQYRCEYCKEEFTSAVHLRKPYACPVCENSPEARLAAENCSQPVNPMQLFETVMPPTQPNECVDLAEVVSYSDGQQNDDCGDDEDVDESSTLRKKSNNKKAFPCKQCTRSYSQLSGLKFHIKTKHS